MHSGGTVPAVICVVPSLKGVRVKTILVSGGTGFIGSHTCVELIEAGYDVAVFDNLSNSREESLNRIERITGTRPRFYRADMLDRDALNAIFDGEDVEAVIHFAGLKAVGESVAKPWEYYHNNITGTLVLLDVMRSHGVKNIVFSSSATVYGDPAFVPITEECPLGNPTNPYGQTKKMLEQILSDLYVGDGEWNVSLLRYFNPIGAHESGLMGEDPKGIPNNLMPYITQIASGKLECLGVFGDDYDTPDGTGVRDYIHVVDLARGHVKTLQATMGQTGVHVWNLGTGNGYSVLDVIRAFEAANGVQIPYQIKPRRAGDIAACYASADKAARDLGWKAEYDMEAMCRDAWNWQRNNPNGYDD
jgi:UDP-glucose 4-epimerase